MWGDRGRHDGEVQDHAVIAGWREWVALPDLGVPYIKAKLDTGARTSALHAHGIELDEVNGVALVRFELHPWQRTRRGAVSVELPLVDERQVRSSTGHVERRVVVTTRLRVGSMEADAEFTLTNRDPMGFRLLIGRTALAGRVLVDSAGSFRAAARPPSGARPAR